MPFIDPGYVLNFDVKAQPNYTLDISGQVIAWRPGDYVIDYSLCIDGQEPVCCQRLVSVIPVSPERTEPEKEKVIYLSFDDGPCENTAYVLELLEKYNAKATFFVITGDNEYCANMLPAIKAGGHAIGVHANNHTYHELYRDEESFFEDFMAAQQLIHQYTGDYACISRFPGGSLTAKGKLGMSFEAVVQGLENMGIRYFDWNVQAEDSRGNNSQTTFELFCCTVPEYESPVSLQHDTRQYSIDKERLLELATLAESASSHPISKSLQLAYGKELDRSRVSNIQETSGSGIIAQVDNMEIAVGNSRLMNEIGAEYADCHELGTLVHIAINREYTGHILIADKLKPNSKAAIEKLRAMGINDTIMLTGDVDAVALKTATELGIRQVYSQLLPGDKVTKVEELLANMKSNEKLAFVGDGINDAPVLSRADVGIAMGALGSDAAIEAADIVLMDDDPMKIAKAIGISRKCLGIVYQNIVFAIGIKVLFLLLGAVGIANMWFAIFADVGVMVIAVLNAIRCLFVDKL